MATTVSNTSSAADIYASLNGSSAAKSSSTTQDMQNSFMTMLVTQLKNQDPLNPMQSAEMTSQLAQINTVSGIQQLNTTLNKLLSTFDSGQSMQAAAMIGKNVLVPGSNISLSSSQAVGGFELQGDADAVKVTIKDANGLVVNTVNMGAAKAGSHLYAWDGKTDSGATAADGTYTVTVEATQGSSKVVSTALQVGMVSAVVPGTNGFQIDAGTGALINYTDVRQIL